VGVYDHIRGDGREFVVCDPTAVKIKSEDGRAVTDVDISPFINNLPLSTASTTHFSTTSASGSTSQAANIIEAVDLCYEFHGSR
jgi:predicted ABC-class ATPase